MDGTGLADGRAPTRVRNRPTWLLRRAAARSAALLNAAFEERGDGLRGYHYRLLAALEESGPTGQAELGRLTSIDRSDVAAALRELEEAGLVVRTVDPRNRRRNVVTLTRAGAPALDHLERVVTAVQDSLLDALSADERTTFVRLLSRVADRPS